MNLPGHVFHLITPLDYDEAGWWNFVNRALTKRFANFLIDPLILDEVFISFNRPKDKQSSDAGAESFGVTLKVLFVQHALAVTQIPSCIICQLYFSQFVTRYVDCDKECENPELAQP